MPRTGGTEGFAKYGFWLAGYYEDFQGLRCVADDTNNPSADGAYDTNNTHHGNIMNGEATLNPRFRWSIRDRVTNNEYASSDSYLLHNKGISDWTTLDTIRLSLGEKYEGRSRPQYPSGWAHPNRTRYNKAQTASTDDTYMLMASGHDSSIQYFVPLGDTDATYGRTSKLAFNKLNWFDGDVGLQSSGNDPHFYQTAHLTGCFMGERVNMAAYTSVGGDTSYAVNNPERIWFPIKSPAGKPFLNVTTYQKQYNDNRLDNTTPTGADRPIIACSAPLNSRGDGEYFTIRIAHQAYNGYNASPATGRTDGQDSHLGASLQYVLKIGFPSNTTFGTTGSGGGTAAIEWSFDPSSTMGVATGGDSYHQLWDGEQEVLQYDNDLNLFNDFDFKLDYTNNKFKVYHNGTEVTATNTSAGAYSSGYTLKNDTSTSAAFLPKNMTGWELFGTTAPPTASEGAIIHTMIDRAALCIPLTNPPDGAKLPPPVTAWDCNLTANASSIGKISVLDDDSEYNLTAFFLDDDVVDWKLLMFSGNIDRPLWQGVIDSVKINQKAQTNTREIQITARDSLGLLDRQMASWEIGQVGIGDSDVVLSRRSEVSSLADTLHLGAARLDEGSNLLGFSKTGYTQVHNQRTSTHSAHPIQMYNNEDEYGPNNAENEWLGYKVIAVNADTGGAVQYVFEGNPGFSAGDNINAFGFGDHDLEGAITTVPAGVGSFDGKVAIKITGSSYQRETSAALRQTKNENPDGVSTVDTSGASGGTKGWFKFTSQPYRGTDTTDTLEVGDYITIPQTGGGVANSGKLHIVTATISSGGFFWAQTDSSLTTAGDGTTSDLHYNIDKGFARKTTTGLPTDDRNVHAVWMRDLANSRWFRKHFGIYGFEPENNEATYTLPTDVNATDKYIKIPEALYESSSNVFHIEDGVGQIIDSDGFRDTFTFLGTFDDGSLGASKYLVGVEGLSKDHSAGAEIQTISISEDYKHIWLLWSDMRNDGNASADGGYRKKKFGLLEPIRDNYDVEINFTDQFDDEGNMDAYTDLKIDSDLDMWEIDSEIDPSTGYSWSFPVETRSNGNHVREVRSNSGVCISPTSSTTSVIYAHATASRGVSGLEVGDKVAVFNSSISQFNGVHTITNISSNDITIDTGGPGNLGYDSSDTKNNPFFLKVVGSSDHESDYAGLEDWASKGGSLIVMDCSKFFNLNTFINGGRTGQEYGARKSLPDWNMNGYGFPVLMDNYWREATATTKNIAAPYGTHENERKLITEVAELNRTVLIGDTVIETKPSVSLVSDFPDFGYGKITATKGTDTQTPSKEIFWYTYKGKLDTSVVESATSATSAGASPFRITCSGADFVNDGVKVGMRVRNVTQKWVAQIIDVAATYIEIEESGIYQETGSTGTTVASSDSISIPQQLYGCYLFSDSGNNFTSDEAEQSLTSFGYHPTLTNQGSQAELKVNASGSAGTTGAYDEVIIAATVSSRYALRFLMNLKGFVESPNTGTYWIHDKMRYMWSFCLSNTWLSQAATFCWYDIGSIPNYYDMTTDGTSSNFDSFGSVIDMRGGKSLLAFVRESVESTGYGYENNKRLPISYYIGKDNKLVVRPSYNCGEGLTRNSFSTNNVNASLGSHITNVRVYYNGGASFVDFPEPTLNQSYRWKVIELPEAISRNEALSVAQEEYNKTKTKNLKLQGEVLRDETFTDKMLVGGKTGYVADVARWCERGVTARTVAGAGYTANTQYNNYTWSSPQSGSLFPGMVNALDGHLSSAPTNGDMYKRDRFGYGHITEGTGNGSVTTYDSQYYWWGANSISHAVQMVFIPHNCPKVSETYGDHLRMFISLKDGQSGTDIDNAEFTIYISDCNFDKSLNNFLSPVSSTTVSYAPQFNVANSDTTTLNVKHSGLYEIDIPSVYWTTDKPSGAKFVISVDCEYLRALLRRRCGDPTASGILHNAHNIGLAGISNFANTETDSIFPIGIRQYSNMTGAYDTRNLWYAPRIHIVDDLRWRPATSVTVTDSGLNLSSEVMKIKDIRWAVTQRQIENVSLTLERDESKDPATFYSYLFPNYTKATQGNGNSGGGNKTKPHKPIPPPTTYPPNQGGGGYTGGTSGGFGSVGFTPFQFEGGTNNTLSNGSFSQQSITGNNFSLATHSKLAGRMDLQDLGSEGSTFGLLGQKKPPVPKNTQRSVEGLDALVTPSSSTATTTSEGFVLPGLLDPDVSDRYTHTQSIKVRVPDDVADEMLSVDALYSMGGTASSVAVLTVDVECVETGNTKSKTMKLVGNRDNEHITLMGTIPLTGVSTKGNTVKVTIKRTAGSGDDDASYSSVVIHNVKVNFQRFSTKGRSNNVFTTG